jgi:hypothetical protein
VSVDPAIFVLKRPLAVAAGERAVTARLATIRADFFASSRLMLPRTGGVLMVLYFIPGIDAIVSATCLNVNWAKCLMKDSSDPFSAERNSIEDSRDPNSDLENP